MMKAIPHTMHARCTDCGRMFPSNVKHECEKLLGNMLAKLVGNKCNKLKRDARKSLNLLGRQWRGESIDLEAAARIFLDGQQGKDRIRSMDVARRMVRIAVNHIVKDGVESHGNSI